jgi:hypothetical protein
MKKLITFFTLTLSLGFWLLSNNGKAQNIYTLAGGELSNNEPATAAVLNNPSAVATDAAGNIYIADMANEVIKKITTAGLITIIAGNGTQGYAGDGGQATATELNNPNSIATDAAGNVYIAEAITNRIRMVTSAGIISTIAGNGTAGFSGDGGNATAAQLHHPSGVTTDAAGNLYIADQTNNCIRMVTSAGIISTIAGNNIAGFSGDGGNATAAELNNPCGISTDATGNIYIVDNYNQRIRIINTAGIISTFAGNGASGFSGDGGQATNAKLYYPSGIAMDATGNIYI